MIVTIDGIKCNAEKGEYILDIARRNNIFIPTLCHSSALPGQGNCRLCIIEVIDRGKSRVVTACLYPVTHEIDVITNSERIMDMRRTIIMLLYARAPKSHLVKSLGGESMMFILSKGLKLMKMRTAYSVGYVLEHVRLWV